MSLSAAPFLLVSALVVLLPLASPQAAELDLSGTWRFALDPQDAGLREQWCDRDLAETIHLPGTTDLAGKGHPLDRTKMSYGVDFPYSVFPGVKIPERADERGFLVGDQFYLGAAWYQRSLKIPANWRGKHVRLFLERVLWESRVWIDNRPMGSCDSLVTEHTYDLGVLSPGEHRLTVRVDNRMIHNLGTIGHSYGPETQSRWNGIVGGIRLVATDPVFLRRIHAYPSEDRQSVRIRVETGNATGRQVQGSFRAEIRSRKGKVSVGRSDQAAVLAPGEGQLEWTVPLKASAESWDEFHRNLYRVVVSLSADSGFRDNREISFGFRHIARDKNLIRVNGRQVLLRGTLDCAVYPRTGHPPTSVAEWKRVLGVIQSHGFNHVRYHSWCPPEAAFEAADELGLYLAAETPFWVDGWTMETFSKPKALGGDPAVTDFVRREIRRMSDAYGNHPSFALFCIGNEFADAGTDWKLANDLIAEAKSYDARRLYNASTARRRVAADDFWAHHNARGVGPASTDWDFTGRLPAKDLPVIAHETGQRPVFPDYDTILPKFTGPLKPYNLLRYQAALAEAGMRDQTKQFLKASARFQLLQYKAEQEGVRRTPGYAGYHLLMLNDFTGQSEALVGILDPFWESKGVVTTSEVRQWNAPVVPLAQLPRFTWTSEETLRAQIAVSQFGPTDLKKASVQWALRAPRGVVRAGTLGPTNLLAGAFHPLGEIRVPLAEVRAPAQLELEVVVAKSTNRWPVWVYPPARPEPPNPEILVTPVADDSMWEALRAGRRVLLLAHGFKGTNTATTGFESVYWSAGWWGDRFSSLGILCDPKHPGLALFPNDGVSDWQWKDLVQGATTFDLSGAPKGYRPMVQPVPDFHFNRLLGHVFETRVGEGRLMVCGYDLQTKLETRHAARQFRASLMAYLSSQAFQPKQELPARFLQELLQPPTMVRLGAKLLSYDSESSENEARLAIDGQPSTFWHTAWTESQPPYPHELVIGFKRPISMQAVTLLPRQDGNTNGWIRSYALFAGSSPTNWGAPVLSGTLEPTKAVSRISLPSPVQGQYLRFQALSGFGDQPFASLAELEVEETAVP